MRGEVLHYDETQGFGFITGADGNRYTFGREDLRGGGAVGKGVAVEFRESGGQARDVFSIRAQAAIPAAGVLPHAQPRHFGRQATVAAPTDTGMWGYFRNGLTVNYANFRGRARRKEYWSYCLFWTIAFIVVALAGLAIDDALGNLQSDWPVVTTVAAVLFMLATIIPGLALMIRRQHDIGLSGWFYLLVFVPYVGSLIVFVFALIPSQKHENKWGPVPAGITIPPPYVPRSGELRPPAT